MADATPLTPEEIGLVVEVINATVGQRPFKVTDGTQSVAVDDGARAMLLLMLSGTVAVADLVAREPDPAHAVIGLRNHGLTCTGDSLSEILDRVAPRVLRQVPMT